MSRLIIQTMTIKKTSAETSEMAKLHHEEGLTLEAIGKQFGMTRQGVRDRFIREEIAIRKGKYQLINRERLETLFHHDQMSLADIAAAFSTDPAVIRKALLFHEIAERQPIKKGGYKVDFLRNLAVGETRIFEWNNKERYLHLHHSAKQIGMKISIRSRGGNRYAVKRIE